MQPLAALLNLGAHETAFLLAAVATFALAAKELLYRHHRNAPRLLGTNMLAPDNKRKFAKPTAVPDQNIR